MEKKKQVKAKKKMKALFERAKKDLEQEEKQTYAIRNINKEAMKKACKTEGLKPKELILKIFREWLVKNGYLKIADSRSQKTKPEEEEE